MYRHGDATRLPLFLPLPGARGGEHRRPVVEAREKISSLEGGHGLGLEPPLFWGRQQAGGVLRSFFLRERSPRGFVDVYRGTFNRGLRSGGGAGLHSSLFSCYIYRRLFWCFRCLVSSFCLRALRRSSRVRDCDLDLDHSRLRSRLGRNHEIKHLTKAVGCMLLPAVSPPSCCYTYSYPLDANKVNVFTVRI